MPAVEHIWASAPPAGRWTAILLGSLLVHAIFLAVLGSASGVLVRQPPPPLVLDLTPQERETWPTFARRAASTTPAARAEPASPDRQAAPSRPALPTLRPDDPEAVAEARAQGVDPVWEVRPDGLAERLARIPPGLVAAGGGGVPLSWRRRCNLPLEGPVSETDRRACEQRFLADAEPPPSLRRQRPQGDPADQFAAQGARNLARYEAQRAPLAGGSGIVGSGECPGGNLGVGCAGAHLQGDMRQGATTNIRQRGNKLD